MAPNAPPQGGGGNVGEVAGYWDTVITKSAGQGNTTTTYADITEFDVSVPEGTYMFELRLFTLALPAADLKVRMQTTGTVLNNVWGKDADEIKDDTVVTEQSYDFTVADGLVIMEGTIVFDGAGTLKAQFAQIVANGTPTEILTGSTFSVRAEPF